MSSLQFESSGIVFGEARTNLNDHYPYPGQFSRLICRRRQNKVGVLHWVFAISFGISFFKQSYHLYNLNHLELCLVRHEPISMTTILIRGSSPGLFAAGVKNKVGVLHRVFAIGFDRSFFKQSCHLYNLNHLELCLVRHEPTSMNTIIIRCSSPGLFAAGVKKYGGCTVPGLQEKFW